MLAVAAATGQLGRKVIERVRARAPGAALVAIARDPAKVSGLQAETRIADYGDPAALERAFAGVGRLLLISSNAIGDRAAQHANAIEAAQRAGVRHVIYTSILHADRLDVALAADHRRTEEILAASGLSHTLLRNGWYWENNTAQLPTALEYGALVGSAGDGRISWAARQDFAEAAAVVLTGDGHEGRIYELAGDAAHSFAELAAEAARQSGRELPYRNLSEGEQVALYESFGLPTALAVILAEIEARALGGGLLRNDDGALARLIGRPTTPLPQAVADALARRDAP